MTYQQLQTLVLNRNYMPMSIWPLSTEPAAAELLRFMSNKCEVLYFYDRKVKCSRDDLYWPSVTVNKRYMPVEKDLQPSHRLLYYRDHCVCVYCGTPLVLNGQGDNRITKEHVIPKSKGGTDDWENLAAACKPCNAKKNNELPGGEFKLSRKPYRPTFSDMVKARASHPVIIHDERWAQFLPNWTGKIILQKPQLDKVVITPQS